MEVNAEDVVRELPGAADVGFLDVFDGDEARDDLRVVLGVTDVLEDRLRRRVDPSLAPDGRHDCLCG